MRSYLFVPGDSPRKMEKALSAGADVILIDLEDSVSLSQKQAARDITARLFERADPDPGPSPHLCKGQRPRHRTD